MNHTDPTQWKYYGVTTFKQVVYPKSMTPDSWLERQSMRPGFQCATQSIVVLLSLGFWAIALWGIYRLWWK